MSLASNLFYGAKTDQVNPNLILLGNEKKSNTIFYQILLYRTRESLM